MSSPRHARSPRLDGLLCVAVVVTLASTAQGCKRLKTGAREYLATKESCPEDRVAVVARDDLHYGDIVLSHVPPAAPSDEVLRDPGRLAKWRSDTKAKDDDERSELNGNLDMFEVVGCNHRMILGCSHPTDGQGSMSLGDVTCFDVTAQATR